MSRARHMADVQEIKFKKGSALCNELNRPHNPFLSFCSLFWWSQLNISRIKIPHLGCCVYKEVRANGVICRASRKTKKTKKERNLIMQTNYVPDFIRPQQMSFSFADFSKPALRIPLGKSLNGSCYLCSCYHQSKIIFHSMITMRTTAIIVLAKLTPSKVPAYT